MSSYFVSLEVYCALQIYLLLFIILTVIANGYKYVGDIIIFYFMYYIYQTKVSIL